jgi:hypothetical protein
MDVLYRWLASARAQSGAARRAARGGARSPRRWWWRGGRRWRCACPARDVVRRAACTEVGQTVDRDALVATLLAWLRARMPLVEERGELSVRGNILDVFLAAGAAPGARGAGRRRRSSRSAPSTPPASARRPLGNVVASRRASCSLDRAR